jgi:hypothetical protein
MGRFRGQRGEHRLVWIWEVGFGSVCFIFTVRVRIFMDNGHILRVEQKSSRWTMCDIGSRHRCGSLSKHFRWQ